MPSKTVHNAADAYVAQDTPNKNFGQQPRMQVRNETGNNKYGYIFFNRPFPRSVRILEAKLRLYTHGNQTGSFTLTARRVLAKWGANQIKWTNDPGVTGATASLTRTGAQAESVWELDVTTIMQDVANGAAWYGLRLDTTTASKTGIFRASQAAKGGTRPELYVRWTEAPSTPTSLNPSGARKVATQKPVLSYDFSDPNGEGDLAKTQVQIASDAAGTTIIYDSGLQLTDLPQWDLSPTAYAGLPLDGTSNWWRVRCQDEEGNTSGYSTWVEMKYAAKGAVGITLPTGGVYTEGSPAVTWTFTGATQKSYQVWISKTSAPNDWIWDSGKITSTDLSSAIPFGIISNSALSYRIGVRIWDTQDRVGSAASPAYSESYVDVTYAEGGTTGVTSPNAVSDPVKPNITITWIRATPASEYQIFRKRSTGTQWFFLDRISEANANIGGTNYSWTDFGVDWYKPYDYKIIAVSGNTGSPGATTQAQAHKLAPFLMRTDGTDVVCFMNPDRSRESRSIQEMHQRMQGPPIVVTQSLGGYTGHVKGLLVDNWPAGYTAEQMRDSFVAIMQDAGVTMRLSYADVTLNVVPFNMTWDSFVDGDGLYYEAEFDWVQV